ncbi:uncharacterized protein A4U43_C04F11830 [Asparagus officinalis]|uniref:Uncharacterized protein n=1 Tax=Asparagus officinalis TaxID=4686 RepID=A0A5P1F055_ASPOF|nr:uncharacterized protein A4U43_C04F11830 [Asparagus officinalis]
MIEALKALNAQKSSEINRLKRELQKSNKRARHLSVDKLEEEQLVRTKLLEESARRKRLSVNFEKAMTAERAVRETTKKKITTLEAKSVTWSQNEGKLHQELEMREDVIKGLKEYHAK